MRKKKASKFFKIDGMPVTTEHTDNYFEVCIWGHGGMISIDFWKNAAHDTMTRKDVEQLIAVLEEGINFMESE